MKVKRSIFLKLMVILFLSVLIVSLESRMDHIGIANAQTSRYLSKTDSALEFLVTMEKRKVLPMLSGEEARSAASIQETQRVSVIIGFDHKLGNGEIAELEAQGLIFSRINGKVACSGTIYGVEIPIDIIDTLKERKDVLRIESAWQPGVVDTLDISVPEINADVMWELIDSGGNNITGEGTIVADFDTGIDVFHPFFWKADGPSYGWIDTNSNGTFDPGTDVVDLNGNNTANTDETLDFFDAEGPAGNNDGVFQVDMDWLYNDANNNGQRDYGTPPLFAEADPTFGELIFIVDDTNANNVLDVGESLIALGTSKVLRTYNAGPTPTTPVERVRGTNLILTQNDRSSGHGTSVCGIINGGTIGRKYVGVAPSAELLVADRYNIDFTTYITWARTNGADVMLYEFGTWTGQFLDGSSLLEQAIDNEAAAGIVQVVPAGNLGHKNKHAQDDVARNGGNTIFTFNVPSTDDLATPADEDIDTIWITALWRTTANNLAFRVTTPTTPIPSVVNLPAVAAGGGGSINTVDGHFVQYYRDDSASGTAKYDIRIDRNKVVLGGWTLQVTNNDANDDEHVDMYIQDNRRSWTGGAVWTAFVSEDGTITWPATADSAITIASYSTRGSAGVPIDGLSLFSPTGPRIDGQQIMDIAAPGNYDIASAIPKEWDRDGIPGPDFSCGSYNWFSGTSAAGPHVAAASALLLQWDNNLTHAQIKTMLQQNAKTDGFTGVTPNHEWGYGKLDVLAVVNDPPVCNANGPYVAECGGATTTISLDGTGSSDPNSGSGDVLTYSWSTDCPSASFDDHASPLPILSLAPGCYSCNVSLTVTDIAGGSDTCSSSVTVNDTQTPTISCPTDVTIECDESTDPANTGTATAVDVCDPSPVVTFSDEITPGTCPEEFTITRTWTATDACGNFSSCVQTINIVDTTPPVIIPALDLTIECDEPTDPSNTGSSTATDNCDSAPTVTFSDIVAPGSCPEEKTITRTWTATDACGNQSSHVQTIEVEDTTAPEISSNAPATIIPPDAPISFTATVTDNCDPDPSVAITGYDCFFFTKKGKRIDKTESCVVSIANDTITILDSGGVDDHITWTTQAADGCGNAAESIFEITVVNPAQ